MRLKFLLLLAFVIPISASSQSKLKSAQYDSILKFRKLSNSNGMTLSQQLEYAERAVTLSDAIKIDTVRIKSNNNLSALCIATGKFDKFREINFENLRIGQAITDSLTVAIANHNLGWYHHRNRIQNDSAYYYYSQAYKMSELLHLTERQVEVLINISEIQSLEKDYIGSEESAIKAIKLTSLLSPSDYNSESLWMLYNRIGDGARTLKMFSKAFEYHQKADAVARNMRDGLLLQLYSQNNIAEIYKEDGELDQALATYESILAQERLFNLDPNFYALVLDNIALTKFLKGSKDYDQLERMFQRAYHIADSLDDKLNMLNVTIDLSKFYKGQNKQEQAIQYAEESYQLATDISSNDILLESMILLSQLKSGDEGKVYLEKHIALSDSLLTHERSIRNKFARIEFETDQLELEKERIANAKMWWTISFGILFITSSLIYIIVAQRNRNKELKFKQDQQETNEEIYNLILAQQGKIDNARFEEKKRISQELHDGILGRLFGARLSLDSFNLNQGKEAITMRSKYISELKKIEEDIRTISHDLNTDFMEGSGFMDILIELVEKQTKAYQLDYEFDSTETIDWEMLSNKTKINIYRMVQEALQNIYKHAEASKVNIRVERKKSVICLSIKDDGVGFDPQKSRKGIGLKNIKSRVVELGGTVEFDSQLDQGTMLKIKIPYTI